MGDPTVETPERNVVEDFYQLAAEHLHNECVLVSFLPWRFSSTPPQGILFPDPSSGLLDTDLLLERVRDVKTLLAGGTFLEPGEQVAVDRAFTQVQQLEALGDDVCFLMAHLLPSGSVENRDRMASIMERHQRMLNIGFDDVLMNPALTQSALHQAITVARHGWQANMQRLRTAWQAAAPGSNASVEGLEELIQQHQQLLWDDIPRALMPHFKLEDPTIVESENAVGSYRLVKRMQTNIGTVVEGLDINNRHVAIKVLNKTTILTPGEVEGVYREYRFLMELLVHPHIAKCFEMLHSTSNIYLVMEYGGSSNLQQLLVSHPGQRLEANPAWDCFAQILDGLAYCHVKQVAHRSICPEHVVISLNRSSRASLPSDSQPLSQGYVSHAAKQSEPGESSSQQVNAMRISSGYHCRLVDFHCAILKKGEWQSQSACSNFPCMSPEMASGESYHCGSSDCWSLGIVLLEMAGGLGSLAAFTGTDFSRDIVDPADIAPVISRSFVEPGSQQRALSMLGATPSVEIVSAATDLLRPEPENRRPLDQMFSALREEGKL